MSEADPVWLSASAKKAHSAVDRPPVDRAKPEQARFRTALFNNLYNVPKLAVRPEEVRKDRNRSWMPNAEPQRNLILRVRLLVSTVGESRLESSIATGTPPAEI